MLSQYYACSSLWQDSAGHCDSTLKQIALCRDKEAERISRVPCKVKAVTKRVVAAVVASKWSLSEFSFNTDCSRDEGNALLCLV